jgi:glycosyltransferase involved in cell wall biosynthesis
MIKLNIFSSMKIVLSHPTANANVRALAVGLADADMLSAFYTCIATFPNDVLDFMSKFGPLSEFRRRRFDPKLEHFTHTWPWTELGRHVSGKMGLRKIIRHEYGLLSIDAVFKNLDRKIASKLKSLAQKGTTAVYSYEDAALETFKKAKNLGLLCNYELPIAYWRSIHRILSEESRNRPEWAMTMTGLTDSSRKLLRKDQELLGSDRIFVASSFTAKTLEDFPGELPPIKIIPYGFPPVTGIRNYEQIKGRPLRILFVGGLSQRKGIATLLDAVDKLDKEIELTFVGRKAEEDCKPLNVALNKHKWIETLSHAEVLQLMKGNDILVLPTLIEGFGLVITEAMSQGTPVITTERSAGPDFIEHNMNGWLVNAGSVEALRSTVEYILNHPESVEKNGRNAMESAKKRPWSIYASDIVKVMNSSNNS